MILSLLYLVNDIMRTYSVLLTVVCSIILSGCSLSLFNKWKVALQNTWANSSWTNLDSGEAGLTETGTLELSGSDITSSSGQFQNEKGWFSFFENPVASNELENWMKEDLYERNDEIIQIVYNPHERETAKDKCLQDTTQTKDRQWLSQVSQFPLSAKERENNSRTYWCNYIYGPATMTVKNAGLTFNLQDDKFWMIALSWNPPYEPISFHIDLCEPFYGNDPIQFISWSSRSYELSDKDIDYVWCSYFFEDEQWVSRFSTLDVQKKFSEFETTEEFCANVEQNKYDLSRTCFWPETCKPSTDSSWGMRWDVCYTKIISEDPEVIAETHHGYHMIKSGYELWTRNYAIGEWLINQFH